MSTTHEPLGGEGAARQQPKRSAAAERAIAGEELACKHLATLNYRIVKRNFRYGRQGEIDIVCYDAATLVFVEVKTRSDHSHGAPEASVDARKQAQLKRIARMYYYVNGLQDVACRFDVIAVEFIGNRSDLRHHKNAFF